MVCKRVGFIKMVSKWLGEDGLQKGGVYEVVVCENKGRMASNG